MNITQSFFVDDCKDNNMAMKKARKILRKKYPVGKFFRDIFSVQQQGHKKGRYIVFYRIK